MVQRRLIRKVTTTAFPGGDEDLSVTYTGELIQCRDGDKSWYQVVCTWERAMQPDSVQEFEFYDNAVKHLQDYLNHAAFMSSLT